MPVLGFRTFAELNTYVTFVLLGCSIMLVVSSVTSAPSFVTAFYMYATGDPNAECEKPFFWNNANTFYNVGTYVTQLSCEALTLVPAVRKVPLRARMLVSLVLPFAELVLLVIVPVIKVTRQDSAIAVLMVVSVMGGFSKALCDSTTNALVGPFPTKFMNGELWGLTVVSLAMSVIQCILKASMGTTFTEVLSQSRIYFGIAMGLQLFTILEFLLLTRNPYAKRFAAEFRQLGRGERVRCSVNGGNVTEVRSAAEAGADTEGRPASALEPVAGSDEVVRVVELCLPAVETRERSGTSPEAVYSPSEVDLYNENDDRVRRVSLDSDGNVKPRIKTLGDDAEDTSNSFTGNAAVLKAVGDADKMCDLDQTGDLTSSDQLLRASLWPVVKVVWPMLFTCFFVYFTSMTLFPGVFFAVNRDGEWYSTVIVLLFNSGDFLSRIILMIRPLRPSPMVCLIGGFCRLAVVPLLALCVHGTLHGDWLPYLLISLTGLTNGFFGAMSMIHCPRTPTLKTAGERSLAAVAAGVLLQCGLAFGSNLALAINLLL